MTTARLNDVLDPVIPTVAEWISNSPGTISLGQGVAYFPPPEEIFNSLKNLSDTKETNTYGPCFGLQILLNSISKKLQSDNNIIISDTENFIMVTAGSNMGFSHVIQAIGDIGDEIILPSPYYFNHHMATTLAGLKPVCVPVKENFQLDLDAISSAITPRTKAIVTVSPNNPTGAVYPEADLVAINLLCADKNIYHISDEAYEYFTFDQNLHYSPASSSSAKPHTISLFSLSKSYGFAGWRIGYLVAPKCLRKSLQKIQDTHLICPPYITQMAATQALEVGMKYPKKHGEFICSTRDAMLDIFNENSNICSPPISQGAFYLLVKFNTKSNPEKLAQQLIQKHKIAALPATTFGLTKQTYLRFSFGAVLPSSREQTCKQLNNALRSL